MSLEAGIFGSLRFFLSALIALISRIESKLFMELQGIGFESCRADSKSDFMSELRSLLSSTMSIISAISTQMIEYIRIAK